MLHIKRWAVVGLFVAAPSLALAIQESGRAGAGSNQQKAERGQDTGRAGQLGQNRGQRGEAAGGQMQFTDQHFIAAAMESGQAEVLLSQLAVERASNEQVKQFAQQMVDEHTRANQQLMQQSRGAGASSRSAARPNFEGEATPSNRQGQGAENRPGQSKSNPGTGAASGRAGGQDSGAVAATGRSGGQDSGAVAATGRAGGQAQPGLGANAAGRLSAVAQAEYAILASKRGEDFDRCYMKGQVAAHMCAVGLFKAESEMGQNSELKEFATQALPKLEQHLQMAKQLAGGDEPAAHHQNTRGRNEEATRDRGETKSTTTGRENETERDR